MTTPRATTVVSIRYTQKPKDGITPRPNLLDGTDFGRKRTAWQVLTGERRPVAGEARMGFRPTPREDNIYSVRLKQSLAGRLRKGAWHVLSLRSDDSENAAIEIVVYGGVDQVEGSKAALYAPEAAAVFRLREDDGTDFFAFRVSPDAPQKLLDEAWVEIRCYDDDLTAVLSHIKLECADDNDLRPSPWCLSEADKAGERGASIRGPQMWGSLPDGYELQSGGAGEDFHDIVIHPQGDGQLFYYACRKSHTKAANRAPSASSPFWAQTQQQELVATQLLLAEKAIIRNLVVEELEAISSRGEMKDVYTKMAAGDFQIGKKVDGRLLPNFKIAMDEDGDVVLEYFKNGQPMGRIDADFFARGEGVSDSWRSETLVPITAATFNALIHDEAAAPEAPQPAGASEVEAHTFQEGYRMLGSARIYNVSQVAVPSAYHQRTYSPRPEPKKWGDGTEGAISGYYRVKTALGKVAFLHTNTSDIHITDTPLPPHDIYEYRRYVDGRCLEIKQIRRKR